jgi:hypothetical protein
MAKTLCVGCLVAAANGVRAQYPDFAGVEYPAALMRKWLELRRRGIPWVVRQRKPLESVRCPHLTLVPPDASHAQERVAAAEARLQQAAAESARQAEVQEGVIQSNR